MQTTAINFHRPLIEKLHQVIMEMQGCCLCAVIGPKDTPEKFLAVFILSHYFDYRQRDIAVAYTVNYHFVPTVVKRAAEMYAADENYRKLVVGILNKLEGYGSENMVA